MPNQSEFIAQAAPMRAELLAHCYRMLGSVHEAEDLVQETYLRAWRSLDDLRDTAAAKGWLMTILRRERARMFEKKTPQFEEIDSVAIDDQKTRAPEHELDDATVRSAIGRLDPKYREPLLMQVLGGFSCDEIAKELKLSSAAVMTQLFRARQKIKAMLGGASEEGNVYELS
jgi:RNA polymerase sigma-70 factor (ECF subfamily)